MFKAATAIVLALLGSAQAHYYVQNINGQTNCLRPLVQYNENFPVTGADISSSKITCGANPASANPASGTCTFAAGSLLEAQYSESSAWHIGPCYVYISGDGGRNWAKIFADNKKIGAEWCDMRFRSNNRKLAFTLPSSLPAGRYVLRVEHIALHQAQSSGGAQIYVRCADINVTGGGSTPLSPLTQFPGAYGPSTPGIMWNPYNGDQSSYPSVGPALYGGSGGNPNPQPQPTATQQPPRTTTATVGQQPPRTTTTTTRPPTGGANLYGQCGGQGWTGPTTCASGTCRASNQYYSQCLP